MTKYKDRVFLMLCNLCRNNDDINSSCLSRGHIKVIRKMYDEKNEEKLLQDPFESSFRRTSVKTGTVNDDKTKEKKGGKVFKRKRKLRTKVFFLSSAEKRQKKIMRCNKEHKIIQVYPMLLSFNFL